jgi:hypothetical protein
MQLDNAVFKMIGKFSFKEAENADSEWGSLKKLQDLEANAVTLTCNVCVWVCRCVVACAYM